MPHHDRIPAVTGLWTKPPLTPSPSEPMSHQVAIMLICYIVMNGRPVWYVKPGLQSQPNALATAVHTHIRKRSCIVYETQNFVPFPKRMAMTVHE